MHVWKTRKWNVLRLVSVTNEVLLIPDCNLQTKNVLINKQGWHHNCEYVHTKPILICFHVSGLEKKEVLIKQMKHFSWQFFQPHEIKITTIITAVKNSLRNVIILKLLRTYWFHEVTLLQLYHLTSTSKHTFTWTHLLTWNEHQTYKAISLYSNSHSETFWCMKNKKDHLYCGPYCKSCDQRTREGTCSGGFL